MAAGREAASAAAIEVILDGYFFLGAGEEGGQGRIREQWTLETSKVGGVIRRFTMRQVSAISLRASVALFYFCFCCFYIAFTTTSRLVYEAYRSPVKKDK